MLKEDISTKFINSVIKSIQSVCHGCVEFTSNIQVLGHIYLSVDSQTKFDYILNEVVCKNNEESSTMFVSNSFHAEPPLKKKNRPQLESSSAQRQEWSSQRDGALTSDANELSGVDVVVSLGEDHCEVTPLNWSSGAPSHRRPQKNITRKRRLSDSLLSCQYSQSREEEGHFTQQNERTADEHPVPVGDNADEKPAMDVDDSSHMDQSLERTSSLNQEEAFSLHHGASDDQLIMSREHAQRRQRFRSQSPTPRHQHGISSSHGDGQQSLFVHSQRLASDSAEDSLPLPGPAFPPATASTSQPAMSRQADRQTGQDRTARTVEQVEVDLTLVKDEDSSSADLSSCMQSGSEFGTAGGEVPPPGGWEGHQNQDEAFQGRGGGYPPMMRLDASGTAVCYEGGMQPPPDLGGLLDNPHLVPVLPQSHSDPALLPGHGDPGQDVMAAVQAGGFNLPRPPLSRPRPRPGADRNLPRAGRVPKEIAEQYGMVELMPNTGVYLHPYQMPNEQRLQGKDGRVCGMRMARHLMSALYSPSELINATLSSNSSRHQPLDQIVTEAITNYCLMRTETTWGNIRHAMRSRITCARTRLNQKLKCSTLGNST